jgi:hypothetical protein
MSTHGTCNQIQLLFLIPADLQLDLLPMQALGHKVSSLWFKAIVSAE